MNSAKIYSDGAVPELKVGDYVELSPLDLNAKLNLGVSLLAAYMLFRAWKHPTKCIFIEDPVLLSSLHPQQAKSEHARSSLAMVEVEARRHLSRNDRPASLKYAVVSEHCIAHDMPISV